MEESMNSNRISLTHSCLFVTIDVVRSMAPDYEELSDAVDASVFIADVNCGDEEELCSEHGVQGYPTIKAYKDGDISDYNGGRTYEDMFEFVQTELANPCDANVLDPETCSAKAIAYVGKWKAKDDTASMSKEITRLQGMKNQHMKSELKVWISQRIGLLKQLSPSGDSSVDDEEL